MKTIVRSEKIPLYLWLDQLDAETLAQAKNLANLPFAFHHVALMADAHVGYGMPIGGVLATRGWVIPNAVGVDIGCGMQAVRSGLETITKAELKAVLQSLRQAIPLGFQHHGKPRAIELMPQVQGEDAGQLYPVVNQEFNSARYQMGTLGGGNHFIEIQQGNDGRIWLMVHSGSRNLGHKVASHYNALAEAKAVKASKSAIPKSWQLASLAVDSAEGQRYLAEMTYCVDFARANRGEMMRVVMEIVAAATGCQQFERPLDIAHNYAARETHFCKEVWVHRKGATRAFAGEPGIIPGSQGSYSYVVRGLGNPDAFQSCSHGAGRVLGRKEAQRSLDLQTEIRRLDAQQVIHTIRHRRDLDEAPGAYKDIRSVMDNQRDLVEVMVELRPLAVLKG